MIARRVIGAFGLVFVVLGFYASLITVFNVGKSVGNGRNPGPHDVFAIMTGINIVFLLLLLVGSLGLIQARDWASTFCKWLFGAELVYILLPMERLAAHFGTGNMGISFQFLSGYPLIGLIALFLSDRYLKRRPARTVQV